MVNKKELKALIEPHFYNDLKKDEYSVENVEANKLLTNTRLDLAFKLLFLDLLRRNAEHAKKIYEINISACGFGKFKEIGNLKKNSFEAFTEDFIRTYKSINTYGFDSNKTLLPLSFNGSIANGAHRVASAIHCNKTVDCVKIETRDHIQDYNFFYQRNVSYEILDEVVTKFIEYAPNVHIAFIWPTAYGKDKQIDNIIPNIVYKKEVHLNLNGAHNLLSQIYFGEDWLGGVENNFKGVRGKLVECFKTFNPVRVIAFQADNLDSVFSVKDDIRSLFKVGKHSVHITDSKEEAVRSARIMFNDNSIHFLNYAKPNKYISAHKNIQEYKNFLRKNGLIVDEAVLDGGMVLSVYGLRESNDIDYLSLNNSKILYPNENIDNHEEQLAFHSEEKKELIFNPKFYFYFNDIKLISFSQLYNMKIKRAENKDKNDCGVMEALIENNKFKGIISNFKQRLYYVKARTRQAVVYLIKLIGFYDRAKSIYHSVKKKNG